MIMTVTEETIEAAARVHSISWQASHSSFCSPEFVAAHTPERQNVYIRKKLEEGSVFYLLAEDQPIGIVSITGNLIEDLYILPEFQNRGYGTKLLRFAIAQCTDTPALWILENNQDAERLYRRLGFRPTGRRNHITGKLDEVEFALVRN